MLTVSTISRYLMVLLQDSFILTDHSDFFPSKSNFLPSLLCWLIIIFGWKIENFGQSGSLWKKFTNMIPKTYFSSQILREVSDLTRFNKTEPEMIFKIRFSLLRFVPGVRYLRDGSWSPSKWTNFLISCMFNSSTETRGIWNRYAGRIPTWWVFSLFPINRRLQKRHSWLQDLIFDTSDFPQLVY